MGGTPAFTPISTLASLSTAMGQSPASLAARSAILCPVLRAPIPVVRLLLGAVENGAGLGGNDCCSLCSHFPGVSGALPTSLSRGLGPTRGGAPRATGMGAFRGLHAERSPQASLPRSVPSAPTLVSVRKASPRTEGAGERRTAACCPSQPQLWALCQNRRGIACPYLVVELEKSPRRPARASQKWPRDLERVC